MKLGMPALGKVAILAGVIVLLATAGTWAALGAHVGWTKTYIEIPKEDAITGIEYTERVDKFVPGVDFLVPGCFAGLVCIFGGLAMLKLQSKKP